MNGPLLCVLDGEDLKELGVSVSLHRKRLLLAIARHLQHSVMTRKDTPVAPSARRADDAAEDAEQSGNATAADADDSSPSCAVGDDPDSCENGEAGRRITYIPWVQDSLVELANLMCKDRGWFCRDYWHHLSMRPYRHLMNHWLWMASPQFACSTHLLTYLFGMDYQWLYRPQTGFWGMLLWALTSDLQLLRVARGIAWTNPIVG